MSSTEDSTATTAEVEQTQPEERPEIRALRQAREDATDLEGKVIGWNRGGFHVVVGGDLTAFCPRSEMELGAPQQPEHYLDKTYKFQVLKVQKRGRRVVLSRTASLKAERSRLRAETRKSLEAGTVIEGRVASLTDFGAFVELGGGIQGLIHVSEISHKRVQKPSDVLEVGQEIKVRILKIEKSGKRISLSIRALESDPWQDIRDRLSEGKVVVGKVEKVNQFGAFVELEPGLVGLLPTSAMSLPREASAARAYPTGREIKVQISSVDPRRQRIGLSLEGSGVEGSRHDYKSYLKSQEVDSEHGFNALASAFQKLEKTTDS